MPIETRPPVLLRFGVFEVDLRAGELRKQGKRIKLQEQPFQVLAVLLQRPGEVVTREELRSQNWPPDTFVDFDNSLNTAINKLREALGDAAQSPRFIETLPRKGYRFIAPVTSGNGKESASNGADVAAAARRWRVFLPVAVILVTVMASGWFWRSRQTRKLTDKDTIVLADFANSTGDSVFEGTLREGLSVQLEQSPFLSLVSEEEIHQTLRMMRQPTNALLTPEIAREVCQRTGSAASLNGSIALIGTKYNLILKAVSCANGDLLASAQAQVGDKSRVLDALGKVASDMRGKLGESLSTVQKYNTPLEQATTPSLEALQAFTLGGKAVGLEGDAATAVAFCQRAIQFDPNFASAYDLMGGANQALGESALSAENIRKAFDLRKGVSELEKQEIEFDYYFIVIGDLVKARQSAVLGEQIYPRKPDFHLALGLVSNELGQYETGLKEDMEALRLVPHNSLNYRLVSYTYLLLNQAEKAVSTAQEAHAKGMDSSLVPILYAIAFYRNDTAEMVRQVAASAAKQVQEDLLLALEADTAAYFGHLGRARELSRWASNSAKRAGDVETSATYEAVAALREGLFGNLTQAGQRQALAKARSGGRDKYYAVLLALAYAEDRTPGLEDDFSARFHEDTVVQFNLLPTLRARLALNRSNPQRALDTLEVTAPHELGLPALGLYNWPNLYPVYVRGEAFLAAHRGIEAAKEFQKILDHRGIVLNEPIGALSHLQLGRAYAMQGESAKSRAAYQDFLTLWKDADPDIPIFKQAKAEYAKVH